MPIEPAIEIFKKYIKKTGQRNTPEKESIIMEIFSNHSHFDVESLFLLMRNKGHNISKASIYRIIPHLISTKLIREVAFDSGHMKYEHILGHEQHGHMICKNCKNIIEFTNDKIQEIAHSVENTENFQIDAINIKITGLCSNCNGKKD
jgi:Fur family ferric uptake transcriptional regulator